jgi:hypothetical protein
MQLRARVTLTSMSIPIEAIIEISRAVAAEQSPSIEVVALASNDGGTGRIELLLTIAGCHIEPCRLLLNLDRADQATFEAALRDKLRTALRTHRT